MGSDTDLPVMSEAAKILDKFEIPYEMEVMSAHRSPAQNPRIRDDGREQRLESDHRWSRRRGAPGGSGGGADDFAGDRYSDGYNGIERN